MEIFVPDLVGRCIVTICKWSHDQQEIRSVELGVCPMQLFHFWSCDVRPVQNLLLCTKFHENRMIFHWDMAIYQFSTWRLSAILKLFYHHTRPPTKSLLLAAAACQISWQANPPRRRKTLVSNRGRWSPLSLFRQVHLGVGKSEYNPPFSGLRASSTWEAVGFCGSHRQTDVLAKLSSWLGGWSPFCGDNGRHTAQVRERRSLRCRHVWVGG